MSEDKPARAKIALPPWLLPVIGAILLLLGLLLAWRGMALADADDLSLRLGGARDRLIAVVAAIPQQPLERFADAAGSAGVVGAAANADFTAAGAALAQRMDGAKAADVHPVDLENAYGGDLGGFGFAKLALLNDAVKGGAPQVAFARDGEAVVIDLAAPVRDRGTLVGIAYARLPLPDLAREVAALAPAGAYLAVLNGGQPLAASGDPALAQGAARSDVPGVPLQVASAVPAVDGLLPGDATVHYGAAGVLVLAGLALLALSLRGRRRAAVPAGASGETLTEAMARAPAATPAPAVRSNAPAPAEALGIDRSIFRAYDIRGVLGRTLDANVARLIGQAIGSVMRDKQLSEIVVGRDGRLSGPELSDALMQGLRETGIDVIDIGAAPTPLLYFATYHLNTGSGVSVTGSHNPPDYNGFKIVLGGETLSGDAIQNLYARIAEGRLASGGQGGLQHVRVDEDYIQRIAVDVQLERRLKVVVDAGNGIAGAIGPQVLEAIGCEVVPLYCDVDGTFPNHHPDPSDPANLRDLVTSVAKLEADLGIAFDGDGDRLGVVTREGEVIYPDRLLMLFAQDVLMRNPGASIIYDVKCTGHLAAHILRHGGSPIMWKTGHSLIKAKMRETEAELAGEMSGHFFFRERWFGFDDGVYAAARLLEILATDDRTPNEIFAELPKGVSTPELKVEMREGEHYAFIERFRSQAKFEGAKIATIDGIRADWPDGWGLVRASNTTPALVLRFDADDTAALARIQEAFRQQLLNIDPAVDLPF